MVRRVQTDKVHKPLTSLRNPGETIMYYYSQDDIDKMLESVPEDVLKEVFEAEREMLKQGRRYRKKPYPSSRDVAEAVIEAARKARDIHPDEFPDLVLKILERKGFEVRHVTVKRIWSTYEKLVRKGVIGDVLGVLIER